MLLPDDPRPEIRAVQTASDTRVYELTVAGFVEGVLYRRRHPRRGGEEKEVSRG
jgi:hypothetical protein